MTRIIGENIKNIPWEDKPDDCTEVFWRSKLNPILTKKAVKYANSIMNSAVVTYNGGFAGIFRIDDTTRWPNMYVGFSKDGVKWEINNSPIVWTKTNDEIEDFVYGYDPRVCKIDNKYIITWCNEYHGPTIGMAYTYDFKEFYQIENAYMPQNRNGVMFPRKINGRYMMLSRPTHGDNIGNMFLSQSPDLQFWGKHRFVMEPTGNWESNKLGAGPIPIETDEGWLIIYHGVLKSCNGLMYCIGTAILDLEKPWIVKHRTDRYIMGPEEMYERVGDVGNVVFPCAALVDAQSGKLAMYYGCADTVVGLAFSYVEDLISFTKEHDIMKK